MLRKVKGCGFIRLGSVLVMSFARTMDYHFINLFSPLIFIEFITYAFFGINKLHNIIDPLPDNLNKLSTAGYSSNGPMVCKAPASFSPDAVASQCWKS